MSHPSAFWSDHEVITLPEGISDGLSWAEISGSLPRRTEIAVRRKAAALGLAEQSEGSPYPIILDDGEGLNSGVDRLLDALTATHAHGTGELSIKSGRPVRSLARPGIAMSQVGSPAAMAAGL